MLDRTIPFYNTILRCDRYIQSDIILPHGFEIVSYKSGFERNWAELEYSIGDFDSVDEAEEYFVNTYLGDEERYERILFAVSDKGDVVGTCIAWTDKREEDIVSSLHWLVVDEKYQGLGIGRALCRSVMNIYQNNNALPVYIHTQPWSYKAIFLYISLGFKLQKTDTFSHYENQYNQAMQTLSMVVNKEQYILLCEKSEN